MICPSAFLYRYTPGEVGSVRIFWSRSIQFKRELMRERETRSPSWQCNILRLNPLGKNSTPRVRIIRTLHLGSEEPALKVLQLTENMRSAAQITDVRSWQPGCTTQVRPERLNARRGRSFVRSHFDEPLFRARGA